MIILTEKRFVDDGYEAIDEQSFTDNLTEKTYWIDNGLDEIVELLNKLNDENIQLKNKLKFLNELNEPYGTLIEENMRLKAFIKRLSNNCGEIILMNGIGYKVDKILGDFEGFK